MSKKNLLDKLQKYALSDDESRPAFLSVALDAALKAVGDADSHHHLITYPQVEAVTGLSRTTLWRRIRKGKFPEPINFGNIKVFRREDLLTWLSTEN